MVENKMKTFFVAITLHTDPDGAAQQTRLVEEMEKLGLGRILKATEGQLAELPRDTFAGMIEGTDATVLHKTMYRGLNAALKKCGLHGRFLITVSENCDWTCCHY